jgi:hypothetical protein
LWLLNLFIICFGKVSMKTEKAGQTNGKIGKAGWQNGTIIIHRKAKQSYWIGAALAASFFYRHGNILISLLW